MVTTAVQPAATCRGLTKTYGSGAAQVRALRGADLDVNLGQLTMLMGPSGCGKTTLVSILSGLLGPDAGECRVLGRDPAAMDTAERARFRGRSIGFVFQSFHLLPALTLVENVAVPLLLGGQPRRRALVRAAETLEQVGLAGRAHSAPAELSGGQQQRVAIARAIVHEPALVVCDEPTSNLDHASGSQILETLRAVARRPDRALLVVTHDSRILPFADRVARMDDGRIVDVVDGPARGDDGKAST